MEFVATSGQGENLEDRLAYLSEQPQILDDRELSFRLLRHYASSVQHRSTTKSTSSPSRSKALARCNVHRRC